MLHKTTQLSVMAMAALAIVAVVAVALFAAGGAQAENVTTNALPYESSNGGNNAVQPQDEDEPVPPATPEACAEDPDEVFSEGHLALFDVYWDPDDLKLVNNPCPPFADHDVTPTVRTPTDFNVLNGTVLHIPHRDQFKIVSKIPEGGNPSEYFVVHGRSPLLDAYQGQSGDKIAWIVAEWPDDVPNRTTGDPDFHFGFSAGLLHPENWVAGTGNPDDVAMIQYEFEAEREPEVRPGDRGAVFASSGATFTRNDIKWDTHNPDTNEMKVAVGEYQHLYWAFTKPGTYVFWAHAKGYPKSHTDGGALLPAGSKVEAVTSEVVRYKFHVGRMADLNVEVTSAEVANAGENVTLTVTARNNGPDDAPNTLVEVDLPDGLTYLRHNESAREYHPDTGGWVIGDLASGALATLTITATVGANTHGQELKTKATISARERIGTSLVTELDPNTDDNMAMWTVIVTAESNVDPTFIAVRSVPENTAPETNVGNPIPVKDPDTANPRFVLTGQGAEDFAVINVAVKEGVPGA